MGNNTLPTAYDILLASVWAHCMQLHCPKFVTRGFLYSSKLSHVGNASWPCDGSAASLVMLANQRIDSFGIRTCTVKPG